MKQEQERQTTQNQQIEIEANQRKRLIKALKNVLAPIVRKNDTHENRIHFASIMNKYLNNLNIKTCMQERDAKLVMVDTHDNVVFKFKKRIGSDSQFGVAYLNMGTALSNMLKFSCKIMSTKDPYNHSEVLFLEKMSALVINKICPNMPILYKTLKCDKPCGIYPNILKECPGVAKKDKYFVVMNELANYDVITFLKEQHSPETYQSITMQMMMAVYAFHNIKLNNKHYSHHDCHLGNFLVHKIKPGGYWKYELILENTTRTMYIPNTGYQIILWDPGNTHQYDYTTYMYDYSNFIGLLGFCEIYYRKEKALALQREIKLALQKIIIEIDIIDNLSMRKLSKHFLTRPMMLEIAMINHVFNSIKENKINFSNIYIDNTPLPQGAVILNKKPYTCV